MDEKIFIIAEIGINHNGDLGIAKKLIDMAKLCDCDAVKFQKRNVEKCYSKEFLDSPRESPWGTTQREQKLGLEFGEKEYAEIDKHCDKVGIPWFASAWDTDSQLFLRKYDLKYNKLASKMLLDMDLVEMVAQEGRHTFISTGLNDDVLLNDTVYIFTANGTPFTLMHCVMKYPCPDFDCKINNIRRLKRTYGCPVGYSCHYPGILAPSVSVALGADAVEVHITLDRTLYGSDQPSSFEKRGLEYVVGNCRTVRSML